MALVRVQFVEAVSVPDRVSSTVSPQDLKDVGTRPQGVRPRNLGPARQAPIANSACTVQEVRSEYARDPTELG